MCTYIQLSLHMLVPGLPLDAQIHRCSSSSSQMASNLCTPSYLLHTIRRWSTTSTGCRCYLFRCSTCCLGIVDKKNRGHTFSTDTIFFRAFSIHCSTHTHLISFEDRFARLKGHGVRVLWGAPHCGADSPCAGGWMLGLCGARPESGTDCVLPASLMLPSLCPPSPRPVAPSSQVLLHARPSCTPIPSGEKKDPL